MSAAQSLYTLQMTDIAIETQRRQLAGVEALLIETDDLKLARQNHLAAQESLSQTRERLHDLETSIKDLTEKVDQAEKRLYSGTVRNPKELQGMEADLQQWRKMRSSLEDQTLETMLVLDEQRANAEEKERSYTQVESAWQGEQMRFQNESAVLRQQLTQLEEKRRQQAAGITPNNLAVYDRLRQRLGHGVALLQKTAQGSACGGCGMTLPTGQAQQIRFSTSLAFCPNCQRILTSAG